MGFGASLAFIAIGAILAFATRFTISGIDLQMIGWILMGVGIIGIIVTFAYTRPRRRSRVAEVIEEEPTYLTYPDETAPPPHVHPRPQETPPHVHTRRDTVEPGPAPGRRMDDGLH